MRIVGGLSARIRWAKTAKTTGSAVVHSLASRLSTVVVNVATGIFVARTLGPDGRGAVAAIALWPLVISGVLTLGIPASLRYAVRRGKGSPADLLSSSIIISAVLGVFAIGVGVAFVPRLLGRYPSSVVAFAQLMMLFTPMMILNASLQAFYESQSDFKRSNAMLLIPPVLTLAGLLFLHSIHIMSPYSVAIVYELPFALMTARALFQLRGSVRLPNDLLQHGRDLLNFGIRAYGIDVVNTIAGQIDQVIVVGLISAPSFGLYVVALNGTRLLAILGVSLNTVILPKASSLDSADAIALVVRSARLALASTLLVALPFALAVPAIVNLTYGNEYSPVAGLAQLFTISVVLGTTTATLTQAFLATGKPEIATVLQCVGVFVTVPLMLTLIPKFGLSGAAYAVDISAVFRFAFVLISFPLFLQHRVPRLLVTPQDLVEMYGRLGNARFA